MNSLRLVSSISTAPNVDPIRHSKIYTRTLRICSTTAFNFHVPSRLNNPRFIYSPALRCSSSSRIDGEEKDEEEPEGSVQEIRIPKDWLNPSKASEESEWLRVTLHKWLDEEYCPELTNVEISNVAARSYYNSLLENKTDLGDILLRMAMELESISYKESFHGAFSSANAAVNLILERIVHG